MEVRKSFTALEAKSIGEKLGINWDKFDVDQFRRGMNVELEHEHGRRNIKTNVTNDEPITTGRLCLHT